MCTLAVDVPSWSVRSMLSRRGRLLAARERPTRRSNATTSQHACSATLADAATALGVAPHQKLDSPAARRNGSVYRQWAERVGPSPFVVSRVRPAPPAEVLPQAGRCPMTRQSHAFSCPLEELFAANVDGVRLATAPQAATAAAGVGSATGTGKLAARAEQGQEVALLVPGGTAEEARGHRNIYHGMRMRRDAGSPWCVWQATRELYAAGMRPQLVFVPGHAVALQRMAAWERQLLALFAPIWKGASAPDAAGGKSGGKSGKSGKRGDGVQRTHTFGRIYKLGAAAGQPAVGPGDRYFELDRVADGALMRLPSDVRRALGLTQLFAHAEPTVLLNLRRGARRLGGLRTGTLAEVLKALCAERLMGHQLRVENFERATLRRQVEAASSASLMIGVHGAQLTSVMWMGEGSALLEILLRYGWCCQDEQLGMAQQRLEVARKLPAPPGRPRPLGDYLAPPACRVCVGYNKPSYANMAHSFGVRYAYYDPPYIEPPQSLLLDRPSALVDAAELARAARLLLELQEVR